MATENDLLREVMAAIDRATALSLGDGGDYENVKLVLGPILGGSALDILRAALAEIVEAEALAARGFATEGIYLDDPAEYEGIRRMADIARDALRRVGK